MPLPFFLARFSCLHLWKIRRVGEDKEGRGKPYALHRLVLNPAKRVFRGVRAV